MLFPPPPKNYIICADPLEKMLPLTYETIEEIATQWVDAPILKVDTLYDLEVWIMYTRYKRELPIYKFYFDDPEKHQLYISSKTGEVQQYTTRRQRFYAWIGTIPHKLYFPALRKHTPLWIRTITITSLIAFLVCLTGLIAGLYRYYRQYKKMGPSRLLTGRLPGSGTTYLGYGSLFFLSPGP